MNVASAVVAGGALLFLVIGDPTAVEVQLLVLLLQSKDCASAWDRDATDVLRYFLAPFVFTGDLGAVIGNCAIAAGVAILHLVAVATYRAVATTNRRGDKNCKGGLPSWAEASATVFFPAAPLAVAQVLYAGTASHTLRALVAGDALDAAVAGVLGFAYLLAVPAAAVLLLWHRPGRYTIAAPADRSAVEAAAFADGQPAIASSSNGLSHRSERFSLKSFVAPRGVWEGAVERRLGMATHGPFCGGRSQGADKSHPRPVKSKYTHAADEADVSIPTNSRTPTPRASRWWCRWFALLPYCVAVAAAALLDGIPMGCSVRYALSLALCAATAVTLAAVRPHRSAAVSFLSAVAFAGLALLCAALLVDGDGTAFRIAAISIVVAAAVVRSLVSAFALLCMNPPTPCQRSSATSSSDGEKGRRGDLSPSIPSADEAIGLEGEEEPTADACQPAGTVALEGTDVFVVECSSAGQSPARTPTAAAEHKEDEVPLAAVPTPPPPGYM